MRAWLVVNNHGQTIGSALTEPLKGDDETLGFLNREYPSNAPHCSVGFVSTTDLVTRLANLIKEARNLEDLLGDLGKGGRMCRAFEAEVTKLLSELPELKEVFEALGEKT